MPFLETSRLRIHYRIAGKPDGVPMLLLHGSFATSRWWEPLFAMLPEDIYAVAPDLRGAGATHRPPTGYTIETLAADVDDFVAALDLRNFDLVGHSIGGAIAIEYALTHADRLATLTLLAPPPIEGVFTPPEGIDLLRRMTEEPELLAQGLTTLFSTIDGSYPERDSSAARFFTQLLADAALQAPAAAPELAQDLATWNRLAEAAQLTLPTLLIWGDRDIIVERAAMTRTLLAIPGANNLDVLQGVGHSPMVEAPLRLAERLVNFITEDYAGFDAVRFQAYDEDDASL